MGTSWKVFMHTNTPTFQQTFFDLQALNVKLSPNFWSFLSSTSLILCSFSSPIVAVQSLNCVSQGHHGLQNARLPCPSLSPGVFSNSCPLSQWCHSTISSSAIPFSSCPQSFWASGSFPMSRLFASGGWSLLHSLNNKSLLSLVNSRYYYGSFEIALNSKSKCLFIL